MKTTCDVQIPDLQNPVQMALPKMRTIVQANAERVAAYARALAPSRSGALRMGIIPSEWEENSKNPFKIGRQVYMDHRMNETFVKLRKDGKRYYYPASQEYGFLVRSNNGSMRKIPGKHFLKASRDAVSPAFSADMEAFVEEVMQHD